jgi:predicted ATPase/DNA-binding SARP family transcriptional activator
VTGRLLRSPRSAVRVLEIGRSAAGGHNLSASSTSFVGRARELVEVKRELATTRLLTITGMPGSGKTRLALEVAKELSGAYPDGVWLVELTSLSDGRLVPQVMTATLREREEPGRVLTNALVEVLREKGLLLVLDNCEHVVDAAARLADALLSSCPYLQVIATSREVLGTEGELVWRVDPLPVPDTEQSLHRVPTAEELARYDAVRLFVERTRQRSPHFVLTAENSGAVAQICRRLEGIPLAIELAAARMGALSLEQLSKRLNDPLKLLTGGRNTSSRQRSLRATLDWSYNLLSAEERVLLRRLSAFAGSWTLEAAEAVGTGDGIKEEDFLKLLSNLVDKSLIVAEVSAGEVRRYRLLEPVRQYARERLEASGEADAFRRRHAEFFLALAEEVERESTGAHQQAWAEWLKTEHDNLRAALSWSLENEPETTLRLAGPLARFSEMQARFLEGSGWFEAALAQTISHHPEGAMVGSFSGRSFGHEATRQATEKDVTLESSPQHRKAPSCIAVQPSLRVLFLGHFEMLCNGKHLPISRNGKALTILKYLLANHTRPVSQDHLMGWLWPESNLKKARWSLNSAIHGLRKLLRDCPSLTTVNCILRDESYYRLCPTIEVKSDVGAFDLHYEEGRNLQKEGLMEEAAAKYEKSIQLYRDDYLVEDLYEDWTMVERERLSNAYLDMLSRLAAHYLESGYLQEAMRACYRILKKDRCHEDSYRVLIRCYALLGLRGNALRHYRLCVMMLRQEHGRAPSPETQDLYASLKSEHP